MDKHISGGSFAVARTIFNSAIWVKPPIYLKIWLWLIGRANYATCERNGYTYQRGELVTTYDEIIRSNSHYHNRSHIFPTIKQIRIILKWLQTENMILVKPLKSRLGLGPTGADTTARTRAYTGLKIIVINYNVYQNPENYKGRHYGRDLSSLGQNIEKGNKEYNNKYTAKKTNRASKTPDEKVPSYKTRNGKTLTGQKLKDFEEFWIAFDDKRDKRRAADSWFSLGDYSRETFGKIVTGAKNYTRYRKTKILNNGGTPKMAQGWLTDERWEDELPIPGAGGATNRPKLKTAPEGAKLYR